MSGRPAGPMSAPSSLVLLLGLACMLPRSVFPAAGATLRSVADLRIAACEPRRAAATRAMLRYIPMPRKLGGSVGLPTAGRPCEPTALCACMQLGELEPGSGEKSRRHS
jgi:hypothetical protein